MDDPGTTVQLDENFSKTHKQVYYRGHLIRGADPGTFEVIRDGWARDGRSAYSQSLRLKADRDSFVVLNQLYAKDRESAFYLGGTIEGADGGSFEVLDEGGFSTGPGFWYRHVQGYARDRLNVYHYILTIGKPRVVKGVDLETFQSLGFSFAKDARKVYHEGVRIQKADPETFEPLGAHYSRDSRRVYYANRTMDAADRDSFEVVEDRRILAKDRFHFYQNDRIIPSLLDSEGRWVDPKP